MGLIRGSLRLVPIVLALSIFDTAQDVGAPKFVEHKTLTATDQPLYYPPFCTTDQPLYVNRRGTPIWLDTDSLLRSATHCEAPIMPSLARQMRIRGYFSVNVLVIDKG